MTDDFLIVGGHSLGGADAYEYAFDRVERNLQVDAVCVLAPARPGDSVIGTSLRKAGIGIRAIGNYHDPVPDVPLDMPSYDEDYEQPFTLEAIDETPAPGSDIIFGRHQVALYVRGCTKLAQGSWPIPLDAMANEIARLYDDPTNWDWINAVDGLYWSMKRFQTATRNVRFLIRRGSHTRTDWFREDLDTTEVNVCNARMSRGFVAGWQPIVDKLDFVLA